MVSLYFGELLKFTNQNHQTIKAHSSHVFKIFWNIFLNIFLRDRAFILLLYTSYHLCGSSGNKKFFLPQYSVLLNRDKILEHYRKVFVECFSYITKSLGHIFIPVEHRDIRKNVRKGRKVYLLSWPSKS